MMGQWASRQRAVGKGSSSVNRDHETKCMSKFAFEASQSHRSERKVAKLRSNGQALGTRKGHRKIGEAYGPRYKKHMTNLSPDIAWKRERKLRNRKRIQDSFAYYTSSSSSKH